MHVPCPLIPIAVIVVVYIILLLYPLFFLPLLLLLFPVHVSTAARRWRWRLIYSPCLCNICNYYYYCIPIVVVVFIILLLFPCFFFSSSLSSQCSYQQRWTMTAAVAFVHEAAARRWLASPSSPSFLRCFDDDAVVFDLLLLLLLLPVHVSVAAARQWKWRSSYQ